MTTPTHPALGVVAPPWLAPARFPDLARAAETAGLDELWLWEDCFQQGALSTAGALLASTRRLRVGVGVMPAPLRGVALSAMEISSLEGMFPGRFVPGVGHGVQSWMGQAGVRAASPLTLLRETIEALRALLAGQRVTTGGRYVHLQDVELHWKPARRVPVLSAASGPKTLRLVGQVADGVIFDAVQGVDGLTRSLAAVDQARAEAGRADEPFQVVVFLNTARDAAMLEGFRRFLSGLGVDVADDAALARKVAVGAAEQVAGVYRDLLAAGATSVVAQPSPDEPDPEGLIAWIGQEVAPLLR